MYLVNTVYCKIMTMIDLFYFIFFERSEQTDSITVMLICYYFLETTYPIEGVESQA